ncbi:autotransporter outer membrane beta-barrel domain-containing protein [Pandoraea fibrosis]|uniref:Autotransporter outer membrane beta-barrel domain-containing protein n=1 Tax=Pandoraea fibrosis TaxID=1891094 RepID=A0ABX6HPM3_9BURK|nr:autotransporter outer membrane beta-barrel domain-containing protein [Pandoraea fibrosis]QHE93962.1 autotransporter outer membrane beta-barrel domain-containing protein [Pandoraea fibrosis]QHF12475.1 autotransporter outer membrane beta-barrel domain-containing protein [Pandoraea fibrosis]
MKPVAILAGVIALFVEPHAFAATFLITNGLTSTTPQTLSSGQTGTIDSGGVLSVSGSSVGITATGNATIVNNGAIHMTGTGRAIRDNTGGLTLTVTNGVGASITTFDADVIQMNKANSNIVFNNYGTLSSTNNSAGGSQAIDFNAITTGTNVLNNFAGGVIQANEADAVRPGVNGVVNNAGIIRSTNNPGSTSSSDGIDAQANSGITIVNAATGLIQGARHGITGGVDTTTDGTFKLSITNQAGGTIQGMNGSGVNIDGFNAKEVVTINNSGTIIGNGVTGDGDGVDVDGVVNITNSGTIRGASAANDVSEGVTVGGGTIVNSGTIVGENTPGGVGRGITLAGVDKDPVTKLPIAPQGIYVNSTIVNSGLIRGQSDSAIAVTGVRNAMTVTIINQAGGVLEGGGATAAAVNTGANDATVINYGTITADQSGKAVDLGSGNSSLQILGGAALVNGDVSGGTGTSTLTITPGSANAFSYNGAMSNFSAVTLGAGTITLNGSSTYTGATTVASGATVIVGDAAHRSATLGSGMTTVAAGATLSGYGGTLGSVTNAGMIAVGSASPGATAGNLGTFTIAGDYVGNNGTALLGTTIAADGTAASDKLVINGNASGTTLLKLKVSGGGAPTSGSGIQLVQVNGTASDSAFKLDGPIQAGAYQYLLRKIGPAGGDPSWFLSTSYASGETAYRAAAVGYAMTPQLNTDFGFTMLGRLQERTGSARSEDTSNGVWGRVYGKSMDANMSGRFDADERMFAAQFGREWRLNTEASGWGGDARAGVTATFGTASASFSDSARTLDPTLSAATGSVTMQAQSVGAYWTRILPQGAYLDVTTQISHYRNKYSDVQGVGATQNGFGAALSGEIGHRFAILGSGFTLEPQAQLAYQYLHLNGFSDSVSTVSGNTTNALRGRLGVKVNAPDLGNVAGVGSASPYLTFDVVHDFLSPGATSVAGASFDSSLAKTWYEMGAGLEATLGRASSLYASVKYARNMGGEYRRNVYGQVGYRYRW